MFIKSFPCPELLNLSLSWKSSAGQFFCKWNNHKHWECFISVAAGKNARRVLQDEYGSNHFILHNADNRLRFSQIQVSAYYETMLILFNVCNVSETDWLFFAVLRLWNKNSGLTGMIKFKQRVMRLKNFGRKSGSPVCCWMVSLMFWIRVFFVLPEVLIWFFCHSKRRDLKYILSSFSAEDWFCSLSF